MSLQDDAKKRLPFFQALADGKTVQWKSLCSGEWVDAIDIREIIAVQEMRIKPEPKLRPYTREEWDEVMRVKDRGFGHSLLVKEINDCWVWIGGNCGMSFEEAMKKFTHLDGSPCGVLEE